MHTKLNCQSRVAAWGPQFPVTEPTRRDRFLLERTIRCGFKLKAVFRSVSYPAMVREPCEILVRVVIFLGGIMVMQFLVFAVIKGVMNEMFYMGFK